jgi:protein phosphatase
LLCSDGLSGQVNDEEIGCLLRILPPAQAAKMFVELSNLRGGPDNITAIVVEVVSESIATANQGSIAIRRNETKRSFSTALGVVTAVCFSAAVILYLFSSWPLAVVASVLGLIALVTGLVQAFWSTSETTNASSRYGNGPYRQYAAVPSKALFEHLVGLMKSLKEAAEERGWEVDWGDLDKRFSLACRDADDGRLDEALRVQSGVIIDLMAKIRGQKGGPDASDSAVDL